MAISKELEQEQIQANLNRAKSNVLLKKRGLTIMRLISQISFVAFISYISIQHMVFGGSSGYASLHAYCPFGGIETLYKTVTSGVFLKKLRPSNLALLSSLVVMGLLLGRGFCGWICPFGSVIEWLGALGKKGGLMIKNIPPLLDRSLRWLKYIILIAILAGTIITGRMVFADYDPYPALFHFGVWTEISAAALIIMAITLVSSIFIERAWCRYACPLGALTAILHKVSLVKVKSNPSACINCKTCSDTTCPVGLSMNELERTNSECIMCLRCADGCRTKAIEVSM